MKDLYTGNYKIIMKEMKEDTDKWKDIYVHELEDRILLKCPGASLVAQWLRICLPMQGTRVRALVQEDPTCHGATKPMSHNYCACASGACAPQRERP